MDVHPTKNVSIGIDPYPYQKLGKEWEKVGEKVWVGRKKLAC